MYPVSFEEGKFRNPNAIMAACEKDNISNISPELVIFSHTTRFKVWSNICKMIYKPHLSVCGLPQMTNIAFGFTSLLLLAWFTFQDFSVLQLKICCIVIFLGVLDKLKDVFINNV